MSIPTGPDFPPSNPADYGLPGSPDTGPKIKLNLIQSGFSSVGLVSPLQRGVATSALVTAALYVLQPGSMFDQHGAKEWSLLASRDAGPEDQTHIPWYVAAIGAGALVSLFI